MPLVRFVGKNVEEIVASACLLIMCFATFANVIARYGVNAPIAWAEELSRYAFIWMVFVGAAVCTKHGRHIAVDAAVKLLPGTGQVFCQLVANLGTALLMVILIYYGLVLAASATQLTSTLGIPTYFIYAVIPLSAWSILVRTLVDMVRDLRTIKRSPS